MDISKLTLEEKKSLIEAKLLEQKAQALVTPKETEQPKKSTPSLSEMSLEEKKDFIRKAQSDSKPDEPSAIWEGLKWIGKAGAGVATGVGEAMNPLAIPNSLEVLGRAAFSESGGVGKRMEDARKNAVLPEMRIEQLAPIVRTGVGALSDLATLNPSNIPKRYEDEKAAQKQYNEEFLPSGSAATGEIGVGVISLAQLASQAPKLAKNISSVFSGKKSQAVSKAIQNADEAFTNMGAGVTGPQKILREMTAAGDGLSPNLEKAILERPGNVKKILNQGGDKVFDSVETFRKSVNTTYELLTETLGDFRKLLGSNNKTKFDTAPLGQIIKQSFDDIRLNHGVNIADSRDVKMIEKYQNALLNPGRGKQAGRIEEVTVSDTIKIIDQLDADLQPLYKGEKVTPTLRNMKRLRDEMDAGLANMFPAYKEAKTLFSGFEGTYQKLRPRIENTGAEGFLGNLFGRNKTEMQMLTESVLKQGKEAAAGLQELSKKFSTGTKSFDSKGAQLVKQIKETASKVELPEAKAFFDDLADKLAARKLNTLSDPQADEINRLVQQYVNPRVLGVQGAAGTVGGFLGLQVGGPAAGLIGGWGAQKVAGSIATTVLTNKAKKMYNIRNVLSRIEDAKETPGTLKKFAEDAKKLGSIVGDDLMEKFLLAVPMNRDWINAIAKTGAAANLASGKPVTETIEFEQGSEIRPRR
jgi:hypothetical protein